MTRKQMLEQRALKQQALINSAKAQARELTPEEQAQFDTLQREIDLINEMEAEEPLKGRTLGEQAKGKAVGPTAEEERERILEITNICRSANERGLSLDADSYIKNGSSVEQVNKDVLRGLMEVNKPHATVGHVQDEQDKFRAAATDSILMRGNVRQEKYADGARDLRKMSLRDLAVETLMREGVSNPQRMDNDELMRRALTPDSAFTSIINDSVNKSMATAYNAANTTFEQWTGSGTLSDFKAAKSYRISEAGELVKIEQGGEFKFDELSDASATRQVATYGRSFGFTREAMINDDLSVLTTVPQAYVRAAKRGINKLVYSTLTTSTTKAPDGNNLFTTGHGNTVSSGAALETATLASAIAAMRKQTNSRGKEVLNIQPAFLIVSPDLELKARQIIFSTADPSSSNSGVANIYKNSLTVIVDAELSGNAWYLAANPWDCDTITVSYLNGDKEPKLESQVGFDFLGVKWRIYHDYGVDVMDHRGLYKNPGASA